MRWNHPGKTKSEWVEIHQYQARAIDCAGCACKADGCPKNAKNAKTGRSGQRSEYGQEISDFQQRMATPESRQIYRQVAETPHLWMKSKFGLRQFHGRGLVKAGQEALRAALTYTIVVLLRYRRQASHA